MEPRLYISCWDWQLNWQHSS